MQGRLLRQAQSRAIFLACRLLQRLWQRDIRHNSLSSHQQLDGHQGLARERYPTHSRCFYSEFLSCCFLLLQLCVTLTESVSLALSHSLIVSLTDIALQLLWSLNVCVCDQGITIHNIVDGLILCVSVDVLFVLMCVTFTVIAYSSSLPLSPLCYCHNHHHSHWVPLTVPALCLSGGYNTTHMTLQMCNTMCQAGADFNFAYFGITEGSYCWCGSEPGTYGQGECSDKCSGSPNVECGGQSTVSVYHVAPLLFLRQNIQSECTACPTTDGALERLNGATCAGGWYAPIAKKKFWASSAFPDTFFECFHGRCTGGYLKGDVDIDTMKGNYSKIQQCGTGAKGRMCAGCKQGYWKFGKDCQNCPSSWTKYLIFLFSPLLCLAYFPMLKYLIGGGRLPSLFVTNAYLQITALFGKFAINWPEPIANLLAQVSVVNFNWNLMFFGCYEDRPNFMENWVP